MRALRPRLAGPDLVLAAGCAALTVLAAYASVRMGAQIGLGVLVGVLFFGYGFYLAFIFEGGTYFLSQGVSFGTGGVGTPAGEVGDQTSIVNPPPPIIFNSRSIPVDSGFNTGMNYSVYLTSNDGLTYGITVSQTGRVNLWEYVLSPAGWQIR